MKFPKFDNVAPLLPAEPSDATEDLPADVIETLQSALEYIQKLDARLTHEIEVSRKVAIEAARLEGSEAARQSEIMRLERFLDDATHRLAETQAEKLSILEKLTETKVILASRMGYIDRLEQALQKTRRDLRKARQPWFERLFAGKRDDRD